MIKLDVRKELGFLASFAVLIDSKVENGILTIPEKMGTGNLRGFRLDNSIDMIVSNYEFNDSLLTKRFGNPNSLKRVIFSFNNIFPETSFKMKSSSNDLPSVQVLKGKLNIETYYPEKTKFKSIFIGIDSAMLVKFLGLHKDNNPFIDMINTEQPILFEELVSPKFKRSH